MKHRITVATLLATGMVSAQAAGLSYDYIEGGYYHMHANATYDDHEFKGAFVGGSRSLSENYYMLASYGLIKAEWSDPGEQEEQQTSVYNLGIGLHRPIDAHTDGFVELRYEPVNSTWKRIQPAAWARSQDYNWDFYRVSFGVRHKPSEKSEIGAWMGFEKDLSGHDSNDYLVAAVGGRAYISKDTYAGLMIELSDGGGVSWGEVLIARVGIGRDF